MSRRMILGGLVSTTTIMQVLICFYAVIVAVAMCEGNWRLAKYYAGALLISLAVIEWK